MSPYPDTAAPLRDGELRPIYEQRWTAQFLGFARIEDEWCLAVKPIQFATGFFEGDTSCPYQNEYAAGEPIRLLAASRALRINALKYLPELVELLTAEAQRCIATINDAKALIQ